MSKGPIESVRRRTSLAAYVFFVAFSIGVLAILFGEIIASGTVLGYVIRGSLLIGTVSGFYIAIVTAWNYTLESDD